MKGGLQYMSWRTVVVNKHCKLSYKNGYLVIRSDRLEMIHLSEVGSLLIENGMVSITSYLINELIQNKISIIFCDEKRNPCGQLIPFYSSFNTSKKILKQTQWSRERKAKCWQQIIKFKIYNQAKVLEQFSIDGYEKLYEYLEQVEEEDITNREGHAAKVYFNLLFGKGFIRGEVNDTNAALDYGYSIILSLINREIVKKGYITPLGINHKNEFNQFNLSCDLMEVFRPLVDRVVYSNLNKEFDSEYKMKLVDVLNKQVTIEEKNHFLGSAVNIFITEVFRYLENEIESIINYEL